MLIAVCAAGMHAQSAQVGAKQAETLNLSAYAELLRSDVRASKVAILTELMGLTENEDKAFWPLYREYDGELAKLGDERVALIAEYAERYEKLTDADADRIAQKALDLEARRQAVKAKYLRPDQGPAVAAHGAAVSPDRAPAESDHRFADLRGASDRAVTTGLWT